MKKFKFKKVLALVLGVAMLLPAATVNAAERDTNQARKYVALGDSVSYGMSADPGAGYVDLFFNKLQKIDKNTTLSNLSVCGATSSDLLKTISSNTDKISGAEVITISIGGNNFLKPTIKAVSNALGVDPASKNLEDELKLKISQDPSGAITKVLALKENKEYSAALLDGAIQLGQDFPQIISSIKNLAPKAKIYVNNLYNPFTQNDPFYPMYENICSIVNSQLSAGSSVGTVSMYKVLDVHSVLAKPEYVNLNFTNLKFNPHPTTLGHSAIAEALGAIVDYKAPQINAGWQKDEKGLWYFINEKNEKVKGWFLSDKNWYFMNDKGVMQTGWVKDSSTWYFLNVNGTMKTGWIKDGNAWYYLNKSGAMQTGWVKDGNTWYFLYKNGTMAHDTVIDGYKLDGNGAWVK